MFLLKSINKCCFLQHSSVEWKLSLSCLTAKGVLMKSLFSLWNKCEQNPVLKDFRRVLLSWRVCLKERWSVQPGCAFAVRRVYVCVCLDHNGAEEVKALHSSVQPVGRLLLTTAAPNSCAEQEGDVWQLICSTTLTAMQTTLLHLIMTSNYSPSDALIKP